MILGGSLSFLVVLVVDGVLGVLGGSWWSLVGCWWLFVVADGSLGYFEVLGWVLVVLLGSGWF